MVTPIRWREGDVAMLKAPVYWSAHDGGPYPGPGAIGVVKMVYLTGVEGVTMWVEFFGKRYCVMQESLEWLCASKDLNTKETTNEATLPDPVVP